MTIAENFITLEHGLADRLRGVFETYKASRAWVRTYNQTYRELQECSDRELRDLGFHRTDIMEISRKAADRLH